MDTNPFHLVLDYLIGDKKESKEGFFSSDFLEVKEPELVFSPEVWLHWEAYIANQMLVIQMNIKVEIQLPCSVCNQMTSKEIKIEKGYQTIPLKELSQSTVDIAPIFREALLLEVPQFIECNEGLCPERKEIDPFLKKSIKSSETEEYFPFSDLEP